MPVGIYDLFTVAVGVAGYLIGRHRGLVWQVSGIVTLLLGGLCATVLSRPLGGVFAEGLLGRFVAWVVVYAVVAICLYVLSLRLKHRIEEMEFDELDRRFGGALGAFKGLLAFGVVTLVALGLSSSVKAAVEGSASGRALRAVVHELRPLVPERVYDALGPWADDEPEPAPQPVLPALPAPDPGPAAAGASGRRTPSPRSETPRPETPRPETPRPETPRPAPLPRTAGPPPPPELPLGSPDLDYPEVPRPAAEPRSEQVEDDPFDTSDDPPDPLAPPR